MFMESQWRQLSKQRLQVCSYEWNVEELLREVEPLADLKTLTKKIKDYRTTFRIAHKKYNISCKSGASTDDVENQHCGTTTYFCQLPSVRDQSGKVRTLLLTGFLMTEKCYWRRSNAYSSVFCMWEWTKCNTRWQEYIFWAHGTVMKKKSFKSKSLQKKILTCRHIQHNNKWLINIKKVVKISR